MQYPKMGVKMLAETTNRLWRWARSHWPPLVLGATFFAQTLVFNAWTLGLTLPFLHRMIVMNVGLTALFFGPVVFIRTRRWRYIYLSVIELILCLAFVAQYLFFAYSGSFLQASAIRYATYAGDVSGSIKTLPAGPLAFFLSPLIVLGLVWRLDRKKFKKLTARRQLAGIGLCVLLGVAGLGYVVHQDVTELHTVDQIFTNPYDNGTLIQKVGIIGYSALDLRKYLATPHTITAAEKNFVKTWAKNHPAEHTAGNYFGLEKGKNVIFVQSESFERFLINKKVGEQEITPNLNKFAKDSLYFSHYYYVIGPGHTVDAEFTTENSMLPLQDRVLFFEYPQRKYQTLASQLKQSGYFTAALHANNASFWNRASVYPGQGYQRFYSQKDFNLDDIVGWGLSDKSFFDQGVDKLAADKQPFFAYMITLSQHTPFDLPDNQKTLNIPNSLGLNDTQKAYLQAAHYYDSAFGEFIDQLKDKGLYDNTVIALDGDHTAFIEKEDDQNFAKFLGLPNFTRFNFIKNTQVPLIIHLPGDQLKGEVKTPASHLDVYPTLANLLGLQVPGSVLGHDVLNTKQPEAISLRFNTKIIDAIETDKLYYISSDDGAFNTGECLEKTTRKPVALTKCKPLYDDAQEKLKVSEIAVRGNIIPLLNNR